MSDAGQITVTTRMGRIAEGLQSLAVLLRDPRAAGSLPTFADQLEVMASHAREAEEVLAAAEVEAAEDEPSGTDAAVFREAGATEHEVAALRDDPVASGRAAVGDEPLTWRGAVEAVETLTHFVAGPLPPDATDRERVAQAEAAAAVRMLQLMVEGMAGPLEKLRIWRDEHRNRAARRTGENPEAAPSLEVSGQAVVAAMELAEVFEDVRHERLADPLRDLALALHHALKANGAPLAFCDLPPQGPGRGQAGTVFEQEVRGLAVAVVQAKAFAMGEVRGAKKEARARVAELMAGAPVVPVRALGDKSCRDLRRSSSAWWTTLDNWEKGINRARRGGPRGLKSRITLEAYEGALTRGIAGCIDPRRYRHGIDDAFRAEARRALETGRDALPAEQWAWVASALEDHLRCHLGYARSTEASDPAASAGEETHVLSGSKAITSA
jgi:hypothetical protein